MFIGSSYIRTEQLSYHDLLSLIRETINGNAIDISNTGNLSGTPHGKGFFVQQRRCRDNINERIIASGIRWVALPASMPDQRMRRCVDLLGDLVSRTQLFVWQYNRPQRIRQQIENMVAKSELIGAKGIIIDPEGEFKNRRNAARELMDVAKELTRPSGLTIGFTTIGLALNWRNYPGSEFLSADYGMPQIYDREDKEGETYPSRVMSIWKEKFDIVVPLTGAHHVFCGTVEDETDSGIFRRYGCGARYGFSNPRSKTVDEMNLLLGSTEIPNEAIGWWSFVFLEGVRIRISSENRWDVVRDHELR